MTRPWPILLGATPWIAWSALLAPLGATAAAGAALGVAVAVNGWRWRARRLKALELAALPFLALALVVPWLAANAALAVHLALALVAFGSLAAGSPFTLQYARDDWPPEYWDQPLFRLTNQALTALWGVVFAAVAAIAWAAPAASGWAAASLALAGAGATLWLPRALPRWAVGHALRRRAPYDWPAPAVGRGGGDVVVVGAGIGGLAAAALLAKDGARVTVIEAHDRPGGYCSSWIRKLRRAEGVQRYVFDAGVHDVSGAGPGGSLRAILERVGAGLDWHPVTRAAALDGELVPFDARLAERLGARFPAERAGIAAFLAEMERVLRDMQGGGGIPRPPRTVEEMLAWPARHPTGFRWMERPFAEMLAAFVADPGARRALSAFTPYLADDPALLTAGRMAPVFGFAFDGGRYPAGGSQRLAEALVRAVEAQGGTVRLRSRVEAVLCDAGRVAGVRTAAGETLAAAAVVYNGDVARLPDVAALPPDFAARLRGLKPSCSAAMVTLAVAGVPDLPGVVLAEDVAIANPSAHDASLAPPGHAALTLMRLLPPGGWDRAAPGYAARKKALGDAMIAAAARFVPDLESRILHREDATPASFARYALTAGGAIYGPAPGQAPVPMKTPVPGLLIAGAGTFPGAGVEAVAISGALAAAALVSDRASCPRP